MPIWDLANTIFREFCTHNVHNLIWLLLLKMLPFGTTAPEHFQNRMASEDTDRLEGMVCHIYNVLVFERTKKKCDIHLHVVQMQRADITLNVKK